MTEPPYGLHRDGAPVTRGLLPLRAAMRRQFLWVVGTAAVVVASTVLFTLRQAPVYQAEATLRIEDMGTSGGGDAFSAVGAPSRVETEIEVLRSRAVAQQVVDSLALTWSADALRSGLSVARLGPLAAIVAVGFEATSPELAREVVNAVTVAYVAHRTSAERRQAQAAVDFLEEQVGVIGSDLVAAELALEGFRRRQLAVDPRVEASEQVRRFTELRATQEELASQRATFAALVQRARVADSSAAGWAAYAASYAVLANNTMSAVVQQLATLEGEYTRLLSRRTEQDPDVTSLTETMSLLEYRLAELAQNQLDVLDRDIRSVDSTLMRLSSALETVPTVELEYARLQRQVDLMSGLHGLLQTRLKEAEISEAVEVANVQVIDSAITPDAPVGPRKDLSLMFGVAGGLLLGMVVALLRETSDTRVRSRHELIELTSVPVLATVPRVSAGNGVRLESADRIARRLVVSNAPRSPAAEAYRALRTNISFSGVARDTVLKSFVITSAEPEDGKTTTAVNLAVTLAEQGMLVALVDADQRRPLLHRVLHAARTPGLTDTLAGTTSLDDAVLRIPLSEHARGALHFLPGGSTVPNPAELAGSPAMRHLVSSMADRFDIVILDTPPLATVTDAAVVATLADGVIVVAKAGTTHRAALRRAVNELQGIGARVLGTVLTDVHHGEDWYPYRYERIHD